KEGLHQIEVGLRGKGDKDLDDLLADDTRSATFEVREPRKVLVIADSKSDPLEWEFVLNLGGRFQCTVKEVGELVGPGRPANAALADYKAIFLFEVANPSPELWDLVMGYVRGGGGLAVIPGRTLNKAAYNDDRTAQRLLPGTLDKPVASSDPKGATWDFSEAALRHPMVTPIRKEKKANVDYRKLPRVATRYWAVTPYKNDVQPVVTYAKEGRPAILERTLRQGRGKVLLFTTPMDADEPR